MEERNNGSEHLMGDEDVSISREVNSILDDLGLTKLSINNRRRNMQVFNIMFNLPYEARILAKIGYMSGSKTEGVVSLTDRTSDTDIMHIFPINITDTLQRQNQVKRFPMQNTLYVIEDSVSHPLFKRLRNVSVWNSNFHYQHCNGHTYLAHTKIQEELLLIYYSISLQQLEDKGRRQGFQQVVSSDTPTICGPSLARSFYVNGTKIDYDLVLAVFSPFWPNDVDEWFIRSRYKHWPSSRDIQIIKDSGCHFVGKGFDESSEYNIEWRMSFSMAENILVHTFSNTQMKCYYLMKALLKQKVKPQFPNLMSSYHIKTVMFWVCEETGYSFFKKDSLLRCFEFCIRKLCGFLYSGHLPCYFMPSTSLLSPQVDQQKCEEISYYLLQFVERKKYISFLWGLNSNSGLRGFELEITQNIYVHSFFHLMFRFNMSSFVKEFERKTTTEIQSFFIRAIFSIVHKCFFHGYPNVYTLRVLRHIIIPDLSFVCLSALLKNKVRNKTHYKLQKQYLNLLTNELAVDCCPGLLKRATVYYMTGKFSECMVVVINVLEKLLKNNVSIIGSHIQEAIKCLSSNVCRHLLNPNASFCITTEVRFSPLERPLVPDFVLLEMDFDEKIGTVSTLGWAFIDPIVYAYSLAIVCQNDISDLNTRDEYLQKLREYVVRNKEGRVYSNSAQRIVDNLRVKCNGI